MILFLGMIFDVFYEDAHQLPRRYSFFKQRMDEFAFQRGSDGCELVGPPADISVADALLETDLPVLAIVVEFPADILARAAIGNIAMKPSKTSQRIIPIVCLRSSLRNLPPRHIHSANLAVRLRTLPIHIYNLLEVTVLLSERRVVVIAAMRLRVDYDFIGCHVILVCDAVGFGLQKVPHSVAAKNGHETYANGSGEDFGCGTYLVHDAGLLGIHSSYRSAAVKGWFSA